MGWCIIGSVALTTLARLFVGWLCDRFGPRLTYTGLLVLGSIPVMGIGLAHDFASFLFFRVAIGVIGFVIFMAVGMSGGFDGGSSSEFEGY